MSDAVIVVVGSTNRVKIDAGIAGLQKTSLGAKGINAVGLNVPSGVSDQPMNDVETKTGSINRARAAYIEYELLNQCKPDFSIGMEGGIHISDGIMECFAWITIFDGNKIGSSRTATFSLPKKIMELVEQGYELGDADDIVFNTKNSKQNSGAVGHLSKGLLSLSVYLLFRLSFLTNVKHLGVIDRTAYYIPAVVLAFIPWENPEFYP